MEEYEGEFSPQSMTPETFQCKTQRNKIIAINNSSQKRLPI